jgi:hypothetical protein
VMGVSPAGYYAWRGRPEGPRKTANRALLNEIRRSIPHRGRYGAPRIHAALRTGGHKASRGRVGTPHASSRHPGNNAAAVPGMQDTTIVSGSIPPSGTSPPDRQSAKPLNQASSESGEGQTGGGVGL